MGTNFRSHFTAYGVLFCFFLLLCAQIYPQGSAQDTTDPAKLIQAGKKLLDEGEYERAIIVFLKALAQKAKEETADAYLYLAYSYYALNDSVNCQLYILKLLEIHPEKVVDESLFTVGFIDLFHKIKKEVMAKAPAPTTEKTTEVKKEPEKRTEKVKPPVIKTKAKKEEAVGKKKKFPWLIVGGIALVGAVVAILMLSKKKEIPAGPAILSVTPSGDLHADGPQGGPFTPSSLNFTLRNSGGESLNWSVSQAWTAGPFRISQTTGTLSAGKSTTVSITVSTSYALEVGSNYSDTITFTNNTNGNGNTTRGVNLSATSPAIFFSSFEGGDDFGWGFRDGSGLTTDLSYSSPYSIRVYDPIGYGDEAECYRVFTTVTTGNASFKFRMPSAATAGTSVALTDESTWQKYFHARFWFFFGLDGRVSYYHNSASILTPLTFSMDVWNDVSIHWDAGLNQFIVSVNGMSSGTCTEANTGASITQLIFLKGGWDKTGVFSYFDDVKVERAAGLGAPPNARR
jgi:hypothetical protein